MIMVNNKRQRRPGPFPVQLHRVWQVDDKRWKLSFLSFVASYLERVCFIFLKTVFNEPRVWVMLA